MGEPLLIYVIEPNLVAMIFDSFEEPHIFVNQVNIDLNTV